MLAAERRHKGSGQSPCCVPSYTDKYSSYINKSGFKTPHFKKTRKEPTAMSRWRSHFADGSFWSGEASTNPEFETG